MEICRRYLGEIVNKSEESNIETLTDDLSTQISEENCIQAFLSLNIQF